MKSLRLFLIVFCCGLTSFFTADAQQQKTQPPRRPRASQPAPKTTQTPQVSKPEPVKVLVRLLKTGLVAADGFIFVLLLSDLRAAAENYKPGVAESVQLLSGGPIEAEEEAHLRVQVMTMAAPEPAEWGKNLAGYDFLISWTLDYHERTKSSWSDKLRLDVKETWKVEKVSDSTVTQTWTTSYVLTGEEMSASDESKARAAAKQIETVIAPARGPILKEIRAFIEANRTKKESEKQNP